MDLETTRTWVVIFIAIFQIAAIAFGVWAGFLTSAISKQSSTENKERHEQVITNVDEVRDVIERLALTEVNTSSTKETSSTLKKLGFPEVVGLLGELKTQQKLLSDAYERALNDGDYSRDLSVRLNCLIGTGDGLLYVTMEKLEIGLSCYGKHDAEKKRYDLADFYSRKNYKATVDGVESAYSVHDIIHLLATQGGGATISLEVDAAFRQLTKGVNIGGHEAGTYVLLITAKGVIEDIDLILETAEKYYVEPMKLVLQGGDLWNQKKYPESIKCFQSAKDILEEYRDPNSHYFINIEVQLSCVYYSMGLFKDSLRHAEKAYSLLDDKEWTGNIAPFANECVAYALMKINIPSQSKTAKEAYYQSIGLIHEAIALKDKNSDCGQTPKHMNYENLTVAHMFTNDYASALDDIENALASHPCQKYSIFKGIALLGLGRHSLANKSFESQRGKDSLLTDSLIEYSNAIASGKIGFSLQHVWSMLYGKQPWT